MNPAKFAQMMKYLTRVKEQKPKLPDVFPASELSIPTKTKNVEEIEAINRFVKANPRQDMAGGGMLVQPGFDGTRQGYAKVKKKSSYFTDRITDKERLKFLDEAAKKYGYKDYKSVPITKAKKRGGARYGDREKVIQEANRRQKGTLTRSEVKRGKIPENIRTGALYDPKIKQKMKDTLKKKTLATPRGERLQWIADNGKRYDNPKDFIKAYEKHFNHKLGSKSDALFNKKLLEKDGRIPLTTIDNLQNTGAATDVFFVKPGFSEEEIFKASIIQNNPRVQNKFRNLFSEIHNNVSLYSELGPEGIVERLNSGKLLEDFDFINSTSSGGKQTYGGVHRGITRSSLKVIGIPDEHIVSYQSVRKPLMALSEIIQNLNNPSFAKQYKISPSTVKKISGQLENFLRGEAGLRKDIANINSQLGDVKFNQIFGGVNFEHTLAKAFGKDYKYLPRNYLLKGQFTTKNFNMFKKDVFDLPLIKLMKQYEQGKVSGEQVQKFIDDFNAKTNNYADFSFDANKGKLAYADNSVKYDLSRYNNPEVARKELIKNIDLTMSPQFQKGFKNLPEARDQLKLFKSKEAKNIRSLLAKIGCPGKVAKAYGGRVQFQDGLSTEFCMTEGAKVIKEKRIDSPAQKANYNKMMKVASVGKNMALLKDILGPYGLGGDVLLEGMIAVNKTLTGGTPFKESWQDSWLSNIVGGAYDEAGQKLGRQKLFELRSGLSEGAEEFGDYNRKVEEYYNLISQRNNLDLFKGLGDLADTSQEFKSVDNKIKTAERELGRMETRINAQGGFEAAENEYNRKTAERQDADAATSLQSIGRQFVDANQLNQMLRDDFSGLSSDALPMQKESRPVLPNYQTFKPDIPTLSTYKSMYEEAGVTPPDNRVLEQDLNQERFRQLFEQPGFMGASDTFFGDTVKMAGGGIAKLAGDRSGPPPERGPNSQGLPGLLKRVRNL